jgi:hypothetical protein
LSVRARIVVDQSRIGDFSHESRGHFESSHERDSSLRERLETFTGWRRKERIMLIPLISGVTVTFGFLAWSVFGGQYIWPAISKRERAEALRPILVLHGFRYIGLAVLIPGVVSRQLSATTFAHELAYGDLAAATLALIALAGLRTRLAGPLVWTFNLFGTADLLNAFYQGSRLSLANAPGLLGAGYFIPVLGVPLLLVTHILVFRVLIQKEMAVRSIVAGRAAEANGTGRASRFTRCACSLL